MTSEYSESWDNALEYLNGNVYRSVSYYAATTLYYSSYTDWNEVIIRPTGTQTNEE